MTKLNRRSIFESKWMSNFIKPERAFENLTFDKFQLSESGSAENKRLRDMASLPW